MINRTLYTGTLALCALMLSGCPKDFSSSDEFEEDIQPVDSVSNQDPDIYRGRVMNGQLENALVWLDQGQNGEISSAVVGDDEEEDRPCTSSEDEVLPADPWTVTDAEGRFELDVTGFQCDLTERADWDPREASVMVIAVPDVTINHATGDTVEKAFFMMAPPGLDPAIVTPFTTMAETVRRLIGIREDADEISKAGTDVNRRLGGTEEFVGVYKDYLNDADARRMPFYAQALRRTMQEQGPGIRSDIASEIIGKAISDEPISRDEYERIVTPRTLEVVGSILLDQAPTILLDVDDEIEAQGFDGYSLDLINSIEDFESDLEDPLLLRRKNTYVQADSDVNFDASSAEAPENLAAMEHYDYDLATRIRRADFQGEPAPSLIRMLKLTEHESRVRKTGALRGLELSLDELETGLDSASKITDRFLFSWDLQQGDILAYQQSPRLETGLANVDEYDEGTGDFSYRIESLDGEGRVETLIREPQNGNAEWTLDADWSDPKTLTLRNGQIREYDFRDFETCSESFTEDEDPRVVNAMRELTVTDSDGGLVGTWQLFGHLRDESGEAPEFRILVREWISDNGDVSDNRRWDYIYSDDESPLDPNEDGVTFEDLLREPDQPDLIHSIRIVDGEDKLEFDSDPDVSDDFCADESDQARMDVDELDAFIRFEHIRFTDYLNEIGTAD